MSGLDLRIELQNCRAVHSADVQIADLTVLCGPNACGKTTIARCFEDIIGMGLDYDYWARVIHWINIKTELDSFLNIGLYTNEEILSAFGTYNSIPRLTVGDYQDSTKFDQKVEEIVNKILEIGERSYTSESEANRSFLAFVREFSPKYDNLSINEVANKLLTEIECTKKKTSDSIYKRENSVYDFSLYKINSFISRSESVSFFQGATKIYDSYLSPKKEKYSYSREHSIDSGQIIGIDRILSLKNLGSYTPYIDKNDPFVFEKSISNNNQNLFENFQKLLKGTLIPKKNEKGDNEWYYYSDSEKIVEPLSLCASGIKNLSQLFIAIKRGEITASTLLILDEPETHLHPSLIVDYAALLIQICKKLKARILITTHSPTLVNALWVISRAEKMADTVNFYIAEKVEGTEQFDYKALHNKIGDIFKDFNEAHRKIAEFENM